MNPQITQLIEQYKDEGFFSNIFPDENMIEAAQSKLGVTLPEQFVEYMKKFGGGGINGIDIFGYLPDGESEFVKKTLEYRNLGLPHNLVVIENCDEWEYCIDCDTGRVVNWSPYDNGEVLDEAPDFDSFLLDELENAIENL